MNTYLSQPNPVTARWEGADHLRDPKFQLDAFQVSIIIVASRNENSSFVQSSNSKSPCSCCSIEHLVYFKVWLFAFASILKPLAALVRGIDA